MTLQERGIRSHHHFLHQVSHVFQHARHGILSNQIFLLQRICLQVVQLLDRRRIRSR